MDYPNRKLRVLGEVVHHLQTAHFHHWQGMNHRREQRKLEERLAATEYVNDRTLLERSVVWEDGLAKESFAERDEALSRARTWRNKSKVTP